VSPDSLTPLEEVTEYHAFLLVREENGAESVISKAELHEYDGRKFRKRLEAREDRRAQVAAWIPPVWAVPQSTP
jgi:hypothetical protein